MSKPPAERQCQGCRARAPKHTLWRLVRTAAGAVVLDLEHRVAGRGYHFHKKCADKALVPGKVQHFLRVKNSPELLEFLAEVRTKIDQTRENSVK